MEKSAEVSVAAMQRLEREAFASGRISSRAAMETAGQAVASVIAMRMGQGGAKPPVLVICGPGNNGGDGYVIARLLDDQGWPVSVLGIGDTVKMPPDAAANRAAWEDRHGPVGDLLATTGALTAPVVVDALFGIGLTRGIGGTLAERLTRIGADARAAGATVFAVDVPSGVDADTGEVMGAVLAADFTVTFHAPKPVHRLRPDLCGDVRVAGIGL